MATSAAFAPISAAIFIDSSVPDIQTLIDGIMPGERVFVLDPNKDGLEQIAADLHAANLKHLSSIAIVAHGALGSLNLGSSLLDDGDLGAHRAALRRIGAALKHKGKLELYACDVAAGAAGKTFIADLSHEAGGVDVAASTHEIGRTGKGETWTLDASSSAPSPLATSAKMVRPADHASSASPFTASAMQSYAGTLAATPTNATGQFFVGYTTANSNQVTNVYNSTTSAPASSAPTATVTNEEFLSDTGLDTANGLIFAIDRPANTSSEQVYAYNASGQILGTSASIANTSNNDTAGAFAVDPYRHLIYAATFTGTGAARQQNQIFELSYTPATSTSVTFGRVPYSAAVDANGAESDTQPINDPLSLIGTQSDPTFGGANQFALDAANNRLFYTSYDNGTYLNYPATNGVYMVSTLGNNNKQTLVAAFKNSDGTPNVNAPFASAIAIDPVNKLVYFTTQPLTSGQAPALYVTSMNATNATPQQIQVPAADLNNSIYGNSDIDQDLVFDQSTHSLYIVSGQSNTSKITQLQLNTSGAAPGTMVTSISTFLSGPAGGSLGGIVFNALPTLTTTATGGTATQNGAAVTLLKAAPTITQPDDPSTGGGYLQSATVQVTQGGTVRAGDVLKINGQTFSGTATSFTDTNGVKFNVSYNTTSNTLMIASPVVNGQGVATTEAQFAHVLSEVQYQDGYNDASTGAQPMRTFTYQVNDGALNNPSGINTTTSTLTILRPPVVVSAGYTVPADVLAGATASAAAPGALAGDSDPNGGMLSISAVRGGSVGTAVTGTYGTLTLQSDGAYTYSASNVTAIGNAAMGLHPVDSYSFTVSNTGGSANETFAATIDRAPTGSGVTAKAPEGATTTGAAKAAFANETDADGDALSVASISFTNPANNQTTVGTVGQSIAGRYGELTLNADGSYSYVADNTANYLAAVATGASPVDDFTYTSTDGLGGTTSPQTLEFDVTCFVTGTRIRVSRGAAAENVPVEALRVGDLAVTSSGEHRPIRWIGSRLTRCRQHPRPCEVMPICISAHAFAENRPARDLLVSPGHSLCVDIVGEVLIPAIALVNGSTIRQIEVEDVTYWHVELDAHDVILAENMPAESYLDMGNRGFFAESKVVDLAASPDAVVATHADFCRPFHMEGALVEVVRAQLAARGRQAGWRLEPQALEDIHLVVDGVPIAPRVRDLELCFLVPAGAQSVWLVSGTAVPREVADASLDGRKLGLCIKGLVIDEGFSAPREICAADERLCVGFHPADASWRWTAGRALLPAELWAGTGDAFFLRADLHCPPLPQWVAPDALQTQMDGSSRLVA